MSALPLEKEESFPSEKEIFLRIFAHSKDSIYLVSPDTGRIVFANPKAVEDSSYEEHELLSMPFKELFLPDEQTAIQTILEVTSKWNQGVDPERTLKRKTGRKIIVDITTSIVQFESEKSIFCNVRDITDRVKAERKVKEYSEQLEQKVEERTKELADANVRISLQKKELDDVMNNIKQGIFTINSDLTINDEYSKHVSDVFETESIAGVPINDFLYPTDQSQESQFLVDSLKTVFADPEKWELVSGLLPEHLDFPLKGKIRFLQLEWRAILIEDQLIKVMTVCTDVTEKKLLEEEIKKKETQHNQQLELISQLITLSPGNIEQFIQDTTDILKQTQETILTLSQGIHSDESRKKLMRSIHTIKGSASQFNLKTVTQKAHDFEAFLLDASHTQDFITENILSQFSPLEESLGDVHKFYERTIRRKTGDISTRDKPSIPISEDKLGDLANFLLNQPSSEGGELEKYALSVVNMEASSLFDRLENLSLKLSNELNKKVQVLRKGDELTMDFRFMSPLFNSYLHVIRNTLDHGCRSEAERTERGKRAINTLCLSMKLIQNHHLCFEVIDDGEGVNLEKVKQRLLEKEILDPKELKNISELKLIQKLFHPGFSTKDEVTELSGRGAGLDMVKETLENELNGSIAMYSKEGRGSRLVARFPKDALSGKYRTYSFLKDNPDLIEKLKIKMTPIDSNSSLDGPASLITDLVSLPQISSLNRENNKVIIIDQLPPQDIIHLFLNEENVKHFISSEPEFCEGYLRRISRQDKSSFLWGLEAYLWPGSKILESELIEYSKKQEVIDQMVESISQLKVTTGLPEICATIADEMIMNGMFDAPRDEKGKPKYNHLPRTIEHRLEPHEAVKFSFGVDPDFIGLSIEDPFGALTYETWSQYLKKCYDKSKNQIDQKEGGAGLGLFTIMENCHCFIVNSSPGKKTQVIALIARTKNYEHYQKLGKCLSYFSIS